MHFMTLNKFAEDMQTNFKAFNEAFPKLYNGAEVINQGLEMLLSEIDKNEDRFLVNFLSKMLFGTHLAWMNSYVLTSAGYKTTGLVEVRRAIEFCCYAAKIRDNKKRANLWADQRINKSAQREFSLQCSIPECYKAEKYKFLWPLILIHEEASYYGAHGNFESIIYNYTESHGKTIFHYQMNKEYVPNSVGAIIIIGLRLLQAYNYIFQKDTYFKKYSKFNDVLEFIENEVEKARIQLAYREYNGTIPKRIIKNIKTDNKEEVNKLFLEMIKNRQ